MQCARKSLGVILAFVDSILDYVCRKWLVHFITCARRSVRYAGLDYVSA